MNSFTSLTKYKVDFFWKWFISISEQLLLEYPESRLLFELDQQVKRLGDFDWEIGPFHKSPNLYLAISPNLDLEMFAWTKEIIKGAPVCKGWVFLDAKPKKEYSKLVYLKTNSGYSLTIDISNWVYSLLYFEEDNSFDIDIYIDTAQKKTVIDHLAADIILTNILGEEIYMSFFKNVQILELSSIDAQLMTPLTSLEEHVRGFLVKK